MDVVLNALRAANPSFIESDAELMKIKIELYKLAIADKSKGFEVSFLSHLVRLYILHFLIQAALKKAPIVAKKIDQFETYLDSLEWTDSEHEFYEKVLLIRLLRNFEDSEFKRRGSANNTHSPRCYI